MPYPDFTPDQIARFWSYVDKRGPDDCWLWTYELDRRGYGSFRIRRDGKRPRFIASRLAWLFTYGTLPDGMDICHRCDTPACINPAHLFAGTARDNIQDAKAKGRMVPPPPRSYVKLTENAVIDIRRRYAAGGVTYKALANEYGVHMTAIYQVVKRKVWRHI